MRKLTTEDLTYLRSLKKKPNENDVRYKEIIKRKLLDNDKLIYLLHNAELEKADAENDDYYGVSIRPQYLIPETQTDVRNFLCYEISFDEAPRYNSALKIQQVIFYILVHKDDVIVEELSAARHDLIAAVLSDEFHGSNIFGNQLKLVSDKPSVVDNDYLSRTLIFEQVTINSLKNTDGKQFNLRK